MPNIPAYDHHHAVQFYGDSGSLCTTVATFLSQGFVDSHPAVIIATPRHSSSILGQLRERGIDVGAAEKSGSLVVLDAHRTLDLFMVEGEPDANRFESTVGGLIAGLVGRDRRVLVRAYGEMVDVLWRQGKPDAAIRLEILWNKLAQRYGFSLLCGYSMGHFYKQTDRFEEVCRQHTTIVPPLLTDLA